MEYDYKIEGLSAIFAMDAEMNKAHLEQCKKIFKDQNPDQNLPEHMANPFNVATALSVMADEIVQLKKRCI
jgi:hypothetical protein